LREVDEYLWGGAIRPRDGVRVNYSEAGKTLTSSSVNPSTPCPVVRTKFVDDPYLPELALLRSILTSHIPKVRLT
jgi:hypothetical protein